MPASSSGRSGGKARAFCCKGDDLRHRTRRCFRAANGQGFGVENVQRFGCRIDRIKVVRITIDCISQLAVDLFSQVRLGPCNFFCRKNLCCTYLFLAFFLFFFLFFSCTVFGTTGVPFLVLPPSPNFGTTVFGSTNFGTTVFGTSSAYGIAVSVIRLTLTDNNRTNFLKFLQNH